MFKLSRRSEYALMAVQHIARCEAAAAAAQDEEQTRDSASKPSSSDSRPCGRVSVASMARSEQIPQPLLAKVMQGLKKAGIVRSIKGVGGGYVLAKPLQEVMFLDVISPFEDQIGLVDCAGRQNVPCDRADCCSLQDPIKTLNAFLMSQLTVLSMADFLAMSTPRSPAGQRGWFTQIGTFSTR